MLFCVQAFGGRVGNGGLDGSGRGRVVDQNHPSRDQGAIQSKNGRARMGLGSQRNLQGQPLSGLKPLHESLPLQVLTSS